MASQDSTSIGGAGLIVNAATVVAKEVLVKAGVSLMRGEVVQFNTGLTPDAVDTMTAESQAWGISADDYEAGDVDTVREIYVAGVFNKDAVVLPSTTLDIDAVDAAFLAGGRIILL